jgi:catechol 2,3-dioxygenase-like lactoylglutathione lyase family enzyme
MIDHISIGVRDVAAAKRFYDAALAPLGYECLSASESSLGYGREAVAFWVGAAEHPVPAGDRSGLHICFSAGDRKAVDAFHAKALRAAGGTTASRACARITAPATTRPSSPIPTVIASRPIAASRLRDEETMMTEPPGEG